MVRIDHSISDIFFSSALYAPLQANAPLLDKPFPHISSLKNQLLTDANQGLASPVREELLVFTVCTDKDIEYLNELKIVLTTLKRQGHNISCQYSIIYMDDGKIYDRDYVESAHLILFLASRAFVSTEYCYSDRISCAVNRKQTDNCCAFPIILEACSWNRTPLKGLSPLPQGGLPVDRWPRLSEAFWDIELRLRDALCELESRL